MANDFLVTTIFWSSVCFVGYSYIGYPLVLMIIARLRKLGNAYQLPPLTEGTIPSEYSPDELPVVAVLVAAFNEEKHIAARIEDLLAQDYPSDRLTILVGSDGSSDETGTIITSMSGVRVRSFHYEKNRGKASVLNDLVSEAKGADVLVFTDANTSFENDAIRRLAECFLESEAVGAVSGELYLRAANGSTNTDGMYWRYERLLKNLEGKVGGLLGANGGIYAIRRELYVDLPADTIVDDFSIVMRIAMAGYAVGYLSHAKAYEDIPVSANEEFGRRVRIGIGNYQALLRYGHVLQPKYGILAFTFFSHKVVRWFTPHLLLGTLVASFLLREHAFYRALFFAQLLVYVLALLIYKFESFKYWPKLLRLAALFVSVNAALAVGFAKYVAGGTSGSWARTRR